MSTPVSVTGLGLRGEGFADVARRVLNLALGTSDANAMAAALVAAAPGGVAAAAASALAAQGYATSTAADRVQTGADRTQTGLDRAQTGANVTASNLAASNASVTAALKNILGTAPTALPFEVTGVSGGVGTGSGGTPGIYALGVSGGPAGFKASVVIGSAGSITGYNLDNPGISTSNAAPTLTLPAGTGLTGATAPTATVGTIPAGRIFYAPSADNTQLLLWGNNAGALATAPFGGPQITLYGKAGIDGAVQRSISAVAPVLAKLGAAITAQVLTAYGDATLSAGNTGNANIYGPQVLTASAGVLTSLKGGFSAAGTGEVHIYAPNSSGVLSLISVTSVSVAAGQYTFVSGQDYPANQWLPAGSIIAYKRLSGGFPLTGTGASYQINGDTGSIGAAITLSGIATGVALSYSVLSDSASINGRLTAVETGLASIGNPTPPFVALLGLDTTAQSSTSLGTNTPATSPASASNLYGPNVATAAKGVPTSVQARLNAAGTGQLIFAIPTATGGYTTMAFAVSAVSGLNTWVAGTHYPAFILPAGSFVLYAVSTGSNVMLTSSGATVGARQWINWGGSSGSAITSSSVFATTDIALSMTVLTQPNMLGDRMTAAEAGVASLNAKVFPDQVVTKMSFSAEFNLVLQFGQSLSRGFQSGNPITTSAVSGGYKFVGGVRADDGGAGSSIYASMVALTETLNGNGEGETPCSGLVTAFGPFSKKYRGDFFYNQGQSILVGSPGQGATDAATLFSGTLLARLEAYITNGYSLASAAGKSFGVPWIGWTHGEQDISEGTTAAAYTATVTAGRATVEVFAQSTTGVAQPLPMIMSQVATHTYYSKPPTIALAQSAMCRANPLMIMSVPRYQFPYSNPQHLTAVGYKMLGSYEAYAASELLYNAHKLQPVDVKQAWRQGNNIIVEFWAERGPLVFDTSFVTDPGGLGFSAVDASGNALTIGTPVIYGGRFVRIPVTARAPIAGDRIQYAVNGSANGGPTSGPRGCLRDSATLKDGTALTYDIQDGNGARPMYFYALISDTTLS